MPSHSSNTPIRTHCSFLCFWLNDFGREIMKKKNVSCICVRAVVGSCLASSSSYLIFCPHWMAVLLLYPVCCSLLDFKSMQVIWCTLQLMVRLMVQRYKHKMFRLCVSTQLLCLCLFYLHFFFGFRFYFVLLMRFVTISLWLDILMVYIILLFHAVSVSTCSWVIISMHCIFLFDTTDISRCSLLFGFWFCILFYLA